MNFKKITCLVAAVATVAGLSAACTKAPAEKVVINGSTTVLPIAQKAAESFMEKNRIGISVSGTGSSDGIKALVEGTCDIANSSREMKAEEKDLAAGKGIKVEEYAIAWDMIVPIVHPSNQVKNLTIRQLKDIYEGNIRNWKEVGGKDLEIVVVSRDSASGTFEVWENKVMNKAAVRKDALLQASNGAVASVVAGNERAVGYVGFGYLNNTLKAVSVDGVVATIDAAKNGQYAIARKLYMYLNAEKTTPATRSFIDYIMGDEGQKLVKDAGFIPVK